MSAPMSDRRLARVKLDIEHGETSDVDLVAELLADRDLWEARATARLAKCEELWRRLNSQMDMKDQVYDWLHEARQEAAKWRATGWGAEGDALKEHRFPWEGDQ